MSESQQVQNPSEETDGGGGGGGVSTSSSSSSSSRSPSSSQRKDPFCWFCHQKITSPFKSCSSCERSFDFDCIFDKSRQEVDRIEGQKKDTPWLCFECRPVRGNVEGADDDLFSRKKLTPEEMLKYLQGFIRVRREATPEALHQIDYTENDDIIHPMDFEAIDAKIQNKAYSTSRSFLDDLKWFHHNVSILCEAPHEFIDEAEDNVTFFKMELKEMGRCVDCVFNFYTSHPKNGFVEPCREPHAIVWAQLHGYPYWPAKAFRTDRKKTKLQVQFFGDPHDKAWVSLRKCFVYCLKPIGIKATDEKTVNWFDKAMGELDIHLKRLEARFGYKLSPAPHMTQFMPKDLIIHELISGKSATCEGFDKDLQTGKKRPLEDEEEEDESEKRLIVAESSQETVAGDAPESSQQSKRSESSLPPCLRGWRSLYDAEI